MLMKIKNLALVIMKEGRHFIAYSPALDLSTAGRSLKHVQKNFVEAAELLLEEIFEAGTADDVLSDLGWKKVQKRWTPPPVISTTSVGITIPSLV